MKSLINSLFIIILFSTLVSCANEKDMNVTTSLNIQGTTIKNLKTPFDKIITGGQPSKNDLKKLAEKGVKNIINLRGENEFDDFDESKLAESLGLNYYSIPIAGAAEVTKENAKKLSMLLKKVKGNSFVHCASSNRVGALFALNAALENNQSIDRAIAIGESAGLGSLKNKVRDILSIEK